MLIDKVGVPGHPQSGHQGPSLAGFDGVHGVQVKVTQSNTLLLGKRKACGCCGCSAMSELCEIVIDHAGHNPFAEIVITHVQPPGIFSELEGMVSTAPDEVVV